MNKYFVSFCEWNGELWSNLGLHVLLRGGGDWRRVTTCLRCSLIIHLHLAWIGKDWRWLTGINESKTKLYTFWLEYKLDFDPFFVKFFFYTCTHFIMLIFWNLPTCWDSCTGCSELGYQVLSWQGWTRTLVEQVPTQTAALQTEGWGLRCLSIQASPLPWLESEKKKESNIWVLFLLALCPNRNVCFLLHFKQKLCKLLLLLLIFRRIRGTVMFKFKLNGALNKNNDSKEQFK